MLISIVSFQFASKELRGDREVVLMAVRSEGRAFQFASEELQGDREVVTRHRGTGWSGACICKQEAVG